MWDGRFDEQGLRTGRYVSYHPNDVVQARGDYVEDQPDGWWRYYRADGSMVREGAWERGRQSGLWRYYYASGARQMEGLYVDNEMVGPWQVWDPQGVTTIRDNGSRAGVQLVREVWPETQQVRRAGARKNGRAVGRWVSFHPNGQPRFRAGLDGKVLVGTFDARNADGGVFAEGRLAANAFAAGCTIVVDGKIQELRPGQFEPLSATVNEPVESSATAIATRSSANGATAATRFSRPSSRSDSSTSVPGVRTRVTARSTTPLASLGSWTWSQTATRWPWSTSRRR